MSRTEQLPLDFEPKKLARRGDPETSHLAAESIKEVTASQHRAILEFMRGKPRNFFSTEQIGDRLGFPIWKRMVELERAGLVRKTNWLSRNRSGRKACTYAITQEGIECRN